MTRRAFIAAACCGLAISAVATVYFVSTVAPGAPRGALNWFAPGLWLTDTIAWVLPPETERAAMVYTAASFAATWIFWGVIASAATYFIYKATADVVLTVIAQVAMTLGMWSESLRGES